MDRAPRTLTTRAEAGATVERCRKRTAGCERIEGLRVVLNTLTGGLIGKGTIAATHLRIGIVRIYRAVIRWPAASGGRHSRASVRLPVQRAGCSTLHLNENDTRRRAWTEQGDRCRGAQHLDGLDIFDVDVVKPQGARPVDGQRRRILGSIDANTIEENERRGATEHGVPGSEPDLRTGTRQPRTGNDQQTGYSAGEHFGDRLGAVLANDAGDVNHGAIGCGWWLYAQRLEQQRQKKHRASVGTEQTTSCSSAPRA